MPIVNSFNSFKVVFRFHMTRDTTFSAVHCFSLSHSNNISFAQSQIMDMTWRPVKSSKDPLSHANSWHDLLLQSTECLVITGRVGDWHPKGTTWTSCLEEGISTEDGRSIHNKIDCDLYQGEFCICKQELFQNLLLSLCVRTVAQCQPFQ